MNIEATIKGVDYVVILDEQNGIYIQRHNGLNLWKVLGSEKSQWNGMEIVGDSGLDSEILSELNSKIIKCVWKSQSKTNTMKHLLKICKMNTRRGKMLIASLTDEDRNFFEHKKKMKTASYYDDKLYTIWFKDIPSKQYPIYDADNDFFPCGSAPEIVLSEKEAIGWHKELERWSQFDDNLFLPEFNEI